MAVSFSVFLHTPGGRWVRALGFVLAWDLLLHGVIALCFSVALAPAAWPREIVAHLLLGALLYGLSRDLRTFRVAAAALLAALHLSNAGKMVVLGAPITPDDFISVRNLFLLLQGWQWFGALLVLLLPTGLLLWMVDWRHARSWLLLLASGTLVTAAVLAPADLVRAMDSNLGNSVWNQRGNFEQRGLLLHLTQEGLRYLARADRPPTQEQVAESLRQLQGPLPAASAWRADASAPRRNVHVILLESFWDPMLLGAAQLSADPLDPEFRALWRQAGDSHALSPVFGGYTANAEFESLCGYPVTVDAVFFEGWLRRDVPCLPRLLRDAGYLTLASHPNIAAFWNRVHAYQRVGFDRYWSDKDFQLDDMNKGFLSDSSLYRQVLAKIEPMLAEGRPVFNYILTYFGHLNYPLNERRPRRIETVPDAGLINGYVNTMYYKSRELMAFLKTLRQRDPGALILLFGDHLPFLGPNYAGFTDSSLLASSRSDFDAAMLRTYVSTPLVVIDGERGPLSVGDVPMYQLPWLIMRLLDYRQDSVMQLTAGLDSGVIRPLPGMQLVLRDGRPQLCKQDGQGQQGCHQSADWLRRVGILTHDLFGGHQYLLEAFQATRERRRDAPPGQGSGLAGLLRRADQ